MLVHTVSPSVPEMDGIQAPKRHRFGEFASGGVCVPRIHSHARWELLWATRIFAVMFVWCLSGATVWQQNMFRPDMTVMVDWA